jgi:D-3-phosphoglycerate dehydrogenase / 2-oxoglutarate reductase
MTRPVTVLLATEKPFSATAVAAIAASLPSPQYKLVELQGYTERSQLLQAAASVDAAIVRSDKCDAEFFAHARSLKVLVRAGAGVDTIDLNAATQSGVVVMNTPGQNSNAVAELAFGMMLSHVRSHFDGGMGSELRGKHLGLHGCGNVSKYMILLARGFGMSVTAFDPFLSPDQIRAAGAEPVVKLEDVFKADFISLHIPLTPETKASINKALISVIPTNGVLINTARQEVIHEGDLLAALKDRADLGYLSDVVPGNLEAIKETLGAARFTKQVLVTPKKMGAQTNEANNNCAPAAGRQIVAFFENGDKKFQVNK